MSDTVSIGVAVVNWNGREDTIACMESLLSAAPRPHHVVVVDNASTDDSATAISDWIARTDASGFEFMVADSNRGFAGANNLALRCLATDADLTHFLLLNNDATVDRDCFAEIDRALAEAPDTGILGVTIYESGAQGRVWYAGGSFVPLRALGRHHRQVASGALVVPAGFVTGCAMLISRRAWQRLGALPECYFMYLEDAEYCVRARAASLPVRYAPRAVVRHRVAAVAQRDEAEAMLGEYWFERSRALFARRNLRGLTRAGALAYLVIVGLARAALRTVRGRPIRAWTAYRGAWAGLLAEQTQGDGSATAAECSGEQAVGDQ